MSKELIDVPIRISAELESHINALGEMCGLTGSQMASAIFVMGETRGNASIIIEQAKAEEKRCGVTEFDDVLHMMEVQGGGFVKALANLYYRADAKNKPRVHAAFQEYFDEYEQKLEAHRAAAKKSGAA